MSSPKTVYPSPFRASLGRVNKVERFNHEHPVSGLLRDLWGLPAKPGKSVRCPFHRPSGRTRATLYVFPDDQRALCLKPSCWANRHGGGRSAWDIAGARP